MTPVLPFERIEPADLSLVGGKALNLGRLLRAGLPIPAGFVITTDAYHARDEEAVSHAILQAYRALGSGLVAVRSSATAEDLEGASFAGQQETFLNVAGEEAVLDAVGRCWASLFTPRAIAYRQANAIAEDTVSMAVVVQRMVAAEAAGVLFTQDPFDPGSEQMLVEGATGLGDAVVSGSVTPDRWRLDRATGTALSAELTHDQPCLTGAQLERLARLGRAVEGEYGAPQDMEWAIQGDELWLLQSRPITATAQEREQVRREEIEFIRARAEPGGTVWARYSLAEVLPEPLPLTWALWKQFMSGGGGYGRMYRELGYDPDPGLDRDGVLDLIAGRPYFNLSRDAKLYFRDFPYDYPFEKLKADPERAIYPTPEANLARAPKGFVFKAFAVTRRMLAAEKQLERTANELPVRLEGEVFPRMAEYTSRMRHLDLTGLSVTDLLEAIEQCRAFVFDEFAPQSLKSSVLAGLAIAKLKQLVTPTPEGSMAVDALLAGVAPAREYDLARALRQLSVGTLSRGEFVDQFGHRGAGEMELARPRWREAPDTLPQSPVPDAAPTDEPDSVTVLEIGHLTKPTNRAAAAIQLSRARRFTALREAGKHFLMRGYEILRLLLLELDRRFELRGGVFYLEPDELLLLAAGRDLRPHLTARRRRRALALGLETPRVLFSDDPAAIGRPVNVSEAAEVLTGTGVSPGVAEGPALVLRSLEQAPPQVADFILVCPSTDPGWVPLFLRARGVVLETGGVLSHGAIVAREFGLPAVVNIPEACRRLRTGERLRVDGGSGRVWRGTDSRPPADQPHATR